MILNLREGETLSLSLPLMSKGMLETLLLILPWGNSIIGYFLTGMALWKDTKAYGYSSPVRSLRELVFGP